MHLSILTKVIGRRNNKQYFLSNFKLILMFNQMYMIPLETKDGENSSQTEQEQIN